MRMIPNLTDKERANLVRFLREALKADRYPLSPRMRRLKALLAKLAPPPPRPEPPPKPPGERSVVLTKKRRR
jgi:hypothetical protein